MTILVTLVSGFASGVFLRSLFVFTTPALFALCGVALCTALVYLWTKNTRVRLVALALAFAMLGVLRVSLADTPLSTAWSTQLGERVAFQGVVVSDPDIREKSQRVQIRVGEGSDAITMLAVAKLSPRVRVGDTVWIGGTLDLPKPFETESGRTFAYDKYLEKDGVRLMLNFAQMRLIDRAPWYSLPAALARVKHLFIDGLERALPAPESALAGGLVIGGKTGLGKELQDAFVRSGLVQIVVLSGYNVMIVAEWVMTLLALAVRSRRAQALAGGGAILLFVGIAGFSSTAVRATIMALIALFARATGKSYSAGRALLVAIFFMLMWNPLYLAYDPGFGLSIAATAGLIWLSPLVERKLALITRDSLRTAVATTIAAQLAVLPLLLYETGNLSLVALPANILAMPLVPAAMAFAAVAGVAGALLGSYAPTLLALIASPAYAGTHLLIELAERSTALPWSAVIIPAFPFWLVLLSYAALACIAWSKRFSTTDQLTLARKAST